MNKVHNLLDDMALACECGCVGFNYLKSHKLECESCGKHIDLVKNAVDNFLSWEIPMGTNLFHAGQAKEMIEAMLNGVGETK